MPILPPSRFASTGSPARILGDDGTDIHIDVLERQTRNPTREVSQTQREDGAPLSAHVDRELQTVQWTIVVSDECPIVGGAWESDHALRTRDRLLAAAANTDVTMRLFDGREFVRTPAGITVWVLTEMPYEDIADEPTTFRATLTFKESPTVRTQFTEAPLEVAPVFADQTAEPVERGRQSTVGANDGGTIAAGAWPS